MEGKMRKNKLKGIIALGVMILSLVLMYVYLTFGQEVFNTKSVLVAATNIEQGTIISNEYFIVKKIRNEDLVAGNMDTSQLSSVIGLASTQYIPKNAQVVSRYFNKPGIVLTDKNFVYKIPNNWIYAVPLSIRRSDDVLIYDIDARIDEGLKIPVTKIAEDGSLPAYQASDAPQIMIGSNDPILETTIIYVKDSANREVVDVDGKTRLDGSSQVSSIEIVCTKEDVKKIEEKVAEGRKLIIVYR